MDQGNWGMVGEWTLDRRLGTGGMAFVFLARHPSHGWCALKIRGENTPVERFLAEARIGRQLNHEFIVRTVDAGQSLWGDRMVDWIALEYVEGKTLDALVQERSLTPEEVLYVTGAICAAITYAHRATGIVHRDLKPENVMLTFDADGGIAGLKILDFGIAKDPSDRLTATLAGPFGTPNYMPPEQWKSPKDVGFTADVWAIALLVFFMLTRRDAFQLGGLSMREGLAVLSGGLPATPEIPEHTFWVLRAATTFEADFRYPSLGQFWNVLRAAWKRDHTRGIEEEEAPTNVLSRDLPREPAWSEDDLRTRVYPADHVDLRPEFESLRQIQTPVVAPTIVVDAASIVRPTVPEERAPTDRSRVNAPPSSDERPQGISSRALLGLILLIALGVGGVMTRFLFRSDPLPLLPAQDAGSVRAPAPSLVPDVPPPVIDQPRTPSVPPSTPTPSLTNRAPSRPRVGASPLPPALSRAERCERERNRLGLPGQPGQARLPSIDEWWDLDEGYRRRVCQFMLDCMDSSEDAARIYIRRCSSPPPVRRVDAVHPY